MQNSRNTVGPEALLFYSETNDGLFPRQLHDTIYASAFAVFNMIDLQGIADIVSWWSFSDIFEEGGFSSVPFNRGYGLQAIYDIDKPAFKAFELLHETGDHQFPVSGSHPTAGVLATQNDTHYQLLIYNHQIPNANINTVNLTITLNGIEPTSYNPVLRRIDQDNSNPIETWFNLGSPEYPVEKEIKAMRNASEFTYYPVDYYFDGDSMVINVVVPPHGVAAITFPSDM
eukprot:TRINITY_DN793_c0_g1_i2.p1 TRINITY_DN793_c0_g1~~TRINITY_DN793_c0_g1_i2.p1  ORF type:complete len:229 (-),score=71.47 TRINITY_DN793_c0_g1_i2:48-734(-)